MQLLKPGSGDSALENAKVLFCVYVERLLVDWLICWEKVLWISVEEVWKEI